MLPLRYWFLFLIILLFFEAHAQQDMDLHLSNTFLTGKNILKVKRDFRDPYLWVLAQDHEVYRINSITGAVDDYSSRFANYHNFDFVDIASDSKDIVFVATNSNNVLKYTNSGIEVIGTSKGISGNVNSIGFDYGYSEFNQGLNNDELLIATNYGLYTYFMKDGSISPRQVNADMRIFESTYRSKMISTTTKYDTYPDTVKYYPVADFTAFIAYAGYIWLEGNEFGKTLKSAYYGNELDPYNGSNTFGYSGNQFWSTENGLFQNMWNGSHTTAYPHRHYLKGININKITSIYGLANVRNLTRENFLLGTTQGLYFSNSNYKAYDILFNYSFYQYKELGNKSINDVCVNATSYTTPICEDGIWVAAIDGLYLLKPDYGPYLNKTQQLQAINFDGHDVSENKIEICANTSIKALVNSYIYNGNIIQWYKDGKELPNESNAILAIKDPGEYYTVLYDPCSALHFESNHLTVTQSAAPVFSFNYPDVLNYCAGTPAQLKTDDKPNYQYRWYKDGVLNGNTTAALGNITETGKYKVEVSACEGSWVASKEVQLNFIAIPTPVLITDKTAYCDGDQALLSVSVPIDGSKIINWSAYQYSWFKDGTAITGDGPSIKVSQGGKYKVTVSGCSGAVSSNEIQVDFIKMEKPLITADKTAYCIGDNANLTVDVTPDPFTTITWFKDDNLLNDQQNKSGIITGQPGVYSVNVVNNTTNCSIRSASYTLSLNPPPVINIQQIVNTTLCDGETIDLKATFSGGSIRWSTGETTDRISVKTAGNYKALITTTAGCTVESSAVVQFLPNPVLDIPNATLCQYTKESITLTAPDGFVKYEWNGQAGNNTFITDKLGSVQLTVTDNNGCKATQTIVISSHCDDIHIPNAFSPNGDGHNDTWVIAGLEGDLSTTVKVYNRLGSMIFQSVGYATPWNGTFENKKLPSGVYYYIISAKGAKQVLSGPVTILY